MPLLFTLKTFNLFSDEFSSIESFKCWKTFKCYQLLRHCERLVKPRLLFI